MVERGRWVAAVAAFALLGTGAVACGDDDSGSSTTAPPVGNGAQANETSGGKAARGDQGGGAATGQSGDGGGGEGSDSASADRDSGGGVEQFVTPGGDNSVQEFGSEADEGELRDAAAVLHAFLDARAAGDWPETCSHLAVEVLESFKRFATESPELRGSECPELLAGASGPATEDARREAAVADVGAMRVEGDRGYVLYHGAGKTPYAIPMSREGGEWKVAAFAGVPLS
jgi:hypothetical protein